MWSKNNPATRRMNGNRDAKQSFGSRFRSLHVLLAEPAGQKVEGEAYGNAKSPPMVGLLDSQSHRSDHSRPAPCLRQICRCHLCARDEAESHHSPIRDVITNQLYHLLRTFTICEVPEAGKN